MKRLALLIGSPSTKMEGDYLDGVQHDIKNMYDFLISSLGGGWKNNEIIRFPLNPRYEQIEPYLRKCESVDFAFIYFSGHGATNSTNSKPVIKLNSYQTIGVLEQIDGRAHQQITIIDACRGYADFANYIGEGLGSLTFSKVNVSQAKAWYDQWLQHVGNERAVLFASQQGENAGDTSRGGLFSTTLLLSARSLAQKSTHPIINIKQVTDITDKKIRQYHSPDIMITSNQALNLPFAVKFDYQHVNTPIPKQSPTLLEGVLKIAGVGFGIWATATIIDELTKKK